MVDQIETGTRRDESLPGSDTWGRLYILCVEVGAEAEKSE